jgi:large subunit ribosomal protein L35
MPKMKTHKGVRNRVKVTGTGKFKRRRAYSNHLATSKTPKRKRNLHGTALIDKTVETRFRRLLPYR